MCPLAKQALFQKKKKIIISWLFLDKKKKITARTTPLFFREIPITFPTEETWI